MGTVGRIHGLGNAKMEIKDTYYRDAKTRRRTKKQERRKTAGYTSFQVSFTCLSWFAAVTNALLRFSAEFLGAFMCVCVCAGEQRGRERVYERWGSVPKPLAECSLVQCGVIRRVHESQTHARARPLLFLINKKSEARIVREGGREF